MNPLAGTPTTTTAANDTVIYNAAAQQVLLSATVTESGGTVNSGKVTFTVFNSSNTQIGSSLTSGTVSDGFASVLYVVPAGTPAGTYTIEAQFSDSGGTLLSSSDSSHTLSIVPASTTTTASNVNTGFTLSGSMVPVIATVTSPDGTVSEGTVTFTVLNGSTVIGHSVMSGTVSDGIATANFNLPAGTALGTYKLQAFYSDIGGNYITSSNTATPANFIVSPAATTTAVSSVVLPVSSTAQTVTLHATVTSSSSTVSGGTVTFEVLNGHTQIGNSVTSSAVSAGTASASYTLPAGTPLGNYTVQATYSGTTGFLASGPATNTFIVATGVTLGPIGPISLPHDQFPAVVPLTVSPSGDTFTYSTTVVGDSLLFDLQQQYQFTGVGYFNATAAGYVLHSNQPGAGVGGYYLIRPSDGAVFAYDGSGNYAHAYSNETPIATLGAAVYTDPTLLLNALPPANYSSLQVGRGAVRLSRASATSRLRQTA